MSVIQNAYNTLNTALTTTTSQILGSIFGATQSMFYNGVAYTIIGVIACIWLLQRLKDGFSKEVIFKAGTWIVIVAFVYAAFSSGPAYYELLSWFAIPVSWLKNGVSAAAGGDFISSMSAITEIMDNKYEEMRQIDKLPELWKKDEYLEASFKEAALAITTIPSFWALYLVLFILIIAVCFMQVVSLFMSSIVISMSPLLLPCLIISPLKGFFFSWIKLFISISMYQPFSLIILAMAKKSVDLISGISGKTLYDNTFALCLPSIIIAIASIYVCKQIPTWVNQLMGTQVGGIGEGAAGGMFGAAREGITSIGKSAAGRALFGAKDSKTGIRSGGLLGAAGGLAKGAAKWGADRTGLTGLAQGAKNLTNKAGNKINSAIDKGRGAVGNGFKAAGKWVGQGVKNAAKKAVGKK